MEGRELAMPSTTVINQKKKIVKAIREDVEKSSLALIADYKGLTVGDITELRSELRKSGATMKVYKNTLARFALKELSIDHPVQTLKQPTALITTADDAVELSKTAVKFQKSSEHFKIRAAVMDAALIDEATVQNLAKLPSREELIAKVVGGIKAPITRLVMSLSSPTNGFVNVVRAIKDKKENI